MRLSLPLSLPALACAALAAAFAQPAAALEITQLPGVTTSTNACYLGCGNPTFTSGNVLDLKDYLPGTGGHGWNAGTHGTAQAPNWLAVDFGALFQISQIDLRFHDNKGAFHGYTNDYQLLGSTDGQQWNLLGQGTLVDHTGDFAALNDTHTFSGASAPVLRHLQYRVVGGSHWSALDELRVEGTPAGVTPGPTAPVPEPATWALMGLGLAAGVVSAQRRQQAG